MNKPKFKQGNASRSKSRGFTLVEALVYVFVLTVIVLAFSAFLDWSIKSNIKAGAMREVSDNARRAMEIMSHEIKEAKGIYGPTSVFDSHPGQLSLETAKYLPEGEKTTYIDFYLCGDSICVKKESQDPVVLTSDNVEVSNLVFYQIVSEEAPSVQIDLRVEHKNPVNRPEYQVSIDLKSAAFLRAY